MRVFMIEMIEFLKVIPGVLCKIIVKWLKTCVENLIRVYSIDQMH